MPRFLTIHEVCDTLRIRRTKFYELVKGGELRITKLGGKTLVSARHLEEFIAKLEKGDDASAA